MRKAAVVGAAVVCACLLSALTEPSAQRIAPVNGTANVGNLRVETDGTRRVAVDSHSTGTLSFVGVTTQTFSMGVGPLVASRACNTEYPGTRLCEWADVFRAIPPPALETDVLIAPNYEIDPATTCITSDGGLKCKPGALLPASCCGISANDSVASIILSPSALDLFSCNDGFYLTATALGPTGNLVSGILILFEFVNVGSGDVTGTFIPASGVSDQGGQVATTLTLNVTSCNSECVGAQDCTTRIRARDAGGMIVSNEVPVIDQIP